MTRKQTVAWFQSQWEQSNIISGILAISIWGTIIALVLTNRNPPDVLVAAGGLITGFFFRSKKESGG